MGLIDWLISFVPHEFYLTPELVERETGKDVKEPAPWRSIVMPALLYTTWWGRYLARWRVFKWYVTWDAKRRGKFADKPESKDSIPELIEAYKINAWEAEKQPDQYATMNEFFARRLKEGLRPLAEPSNPNVAVQPADSRLMVFSTIAEAERLWIKGDEFNSQKLLGRLYSDGRWDDAAIAINRLAPADYHRLHAPVEGTIEKIAWLGKTLYDVEAAAVNSPIDIYGETERAVLRIRSAAFGPVMFCIIGATEVGSIKLLHQEGDALKKGDEVGYFQYGGSVVITLFQRCSICFDQDLVDNTLARKETKVKHGQSLGRALTFRGDHGRTLENEP